VCVCMCVCVCVCRGGEGRNASFLTSNARPAHALFRRETNLVNVCCEAQAHMWMREECLL
jgi:hypothetical protein